MILKRRKISTRLRHFGLIALPALASLAQAGTATFAGEDRATQGSWKSHYGTTGYMIASDGTSAPAGGSFLLAGQVDQVWDPAPSDVRAPEKAATGRIAACWKASGSSWTIDVDGGEGPRGLAIYCLDWDEAGREQLVQVIDPEDSRILDSRIVSGYEDGVYLKWNVKGDVRIRIENRGTQPAVVSGIFVDPAPQPAWWTAGSTPVIDPLKQPENHAAANLGQLKWMAWKALEAVQAADPEVGAAISARLVGAGKPIPSWDPAGPSEPLRDSVVATLGQLKNIAAPFYDHLDAKYPAWLEAERALNGTSTPETHYPWTLSTNDDVNRAAVNIGQMKAVFSLRLETLPAIGADPADTDGDGLPDAWEILHFGNITSYDGDDDPDGNGVSNRTQFLNGTSPAAAPGAITFAEEPHQWAYRIKFYQGSISSKKDSTKPHYNVGYRFEWLNYDDPMIIDQNLSDEMPTEPNFAFWFGKRTDHYTMADCYWFDHREFFNTDHITSGYDESTDSSGVLHLGGSYSQAECKVTLPAALPYPTNVQAVRITRKIVPLTGAITSVVCENLTMTVPANQTDSALVALTPPIEKGFTYNMHLATPVVLDRYNVPLMDLPPMPSTPDDARVRKNNYIQQQIPEGIFYNHVAWITPHGSGEDGTAPTMPDLKCELRGCPDGVKVKWRLEVEYERGNGYRTDYSLDFKHPDDNVRIPYSAPGAAPVFTGEMNGYEGWHVSESDEWKAEIAARGFFGGTAKVYLWVPSAGAAPTQPFVTFRIGGLNPDQELARDFIDSVSGQYSDFSYAVARHESRGYARDGGVGRFYNQFYNEYQGGAIGDNSTAKAWAAWAKWWPIYNFDRERYTETKDGHVAGQRYQNGPGGYGIYQLTMGPKVPPAPGVTPSEPFTPRRALWNWQDNVREALLLFDKKRTIATSAIQKLQAAYPTWPALPDEGHLSALDATTVTYYNGAGGLPYNKSVEMRVPWEAVRNGGTKSWRFLQNSNNYVQAINALINGTYP